MVQSDVEVQNTNRTLSYIWACQTKRKGGNLHLDPPPSSSSQPVAGSPCFSWNRFVHRTPINTGDQYNNKGECTISQKMEVYIILSFKRCVVYNESGYSISKCMGSFQVFFFVIFCFHLLESMPRFYTMKIFKYTLKFGQHLHKLLWEKK
jgi:hypothetical protein